MRPDRSTFSSRRRSNPSLRMSLKPAIDLLETRELWAVTPFTARFSANDTGDIAIIANTLLTLPDSYPNAAGVRAGVGPGSLNNNDYNMTYVDVDHDPTTFNSSTATLSLPQGATVLFAGLYWGADSTNANRQQALFGTPDAQGYQSINGTLIGVINDSGLTNYSVFADVTDRVQRGGNGVYSMANVQANTGLNRYAGWSLVVAYRAPGLSPHNLNVFDGSTLVAASNPNPVDIPIQGFRTPLQGPVMANVGIVSYEGDLGIVGDQMILGGVALSDAVTPVNNFMNSGISNLGVRNTAKNPDYVNQLGFDAKVVAANGILAPNSTSTTVSLKTSGDGYYPSVVTTSIPLFAPNVTAVKSVVDPNGGITRPGDTLRYTVVVTDNSGDAAKNIVLADAIPANTSYVPGSLVIDKAGKTDAVGDDQAEYLGNGTNQVVFRLGAGSNASTGGTLPIGGTTTVSFDVKIDPNLPSDANVGNQATIQFTGVTTGSSYNGSSNQVITPVIIPKADLSVTKGVNNASPNVGDTITYIVGLSNLGPDNATGVSIRDLLPGGLSFVSATPSTGSYDPVSGTWTVGTVTSLAPQNLSITARVVDSGTQLNLAAVLHSDQFDPVSINNTAEVAVTPQIADLAVTKVVNNLRPNVGDTVTYTIGVSNAGPDAATGVVVNDTLRTGLTFVSATPSEGSYDPVTGAWTVGTVADGGSQTLTIRATVINPGQVINSAQVTHSDQFDPDLGDNLSTATVIPQQADLALFKGVSDPAPEVGETIRYTIAIFNTGPDTATGVSVADGLPAGITYVSSTASEGSYDPVAKLWTVGTVPVGSQTLTITVLVTGPDPQSNTATIVSSDQFDPNPNNKSNTASIDPLVADLGIIKSVDQPRPNVGDTITYTITLVNSGPSGATGVTVGDVLPGGLQLVSTVPSQGTYEPSTSTWTVGAVALGAKETLQISAKVIGSTPETNVATITHSDQFDPSTGNNSNSSTVTPQQADLVVVKSVDDPTPNVGQTITYTISLRNDGPNTATAVTLGDLLPVGLQFVTATPTQGVYDAATGVWTVGTVDTDAVRRLVITGKVIDSRSETNTGRVTHSDQFDPNLLNNQSTATVTPQQADLAVAKSVDDPTPNVGQTVTYTVTLSNHGPDTATAVTLADRLPAGLQLVSATPSQGTYDPTSGAWAVGTVANSATGRLVIAARVVASEPETNTATLTHADQFDPDGTNNQSTVTVTPQIADLSLTKSVNNPSPNVGDTVTYTIRLTNAGPDAATGVAVRDSLPVGLTFVSATPSEGSYDRVAGIWTVGTVANGDSRTLILLARVVSSSRQINTVRVDRVDQFDPHLEDRIGTSMVTPQQADLAVAKSVDDPTPNVGQTVTYTVTLSNHGPDTATAVTLADRLPAGLQLVSATPSQGTYDPTSGAWAVGTVANSATRRLVIAARVISPDTGINTVAVTHSDQFDPDPSNTSSSARITPQLADIAVSKTVSNPAPLLGATVTFIVSLSNLGPDPASDVIARNTLPAGLTFVSAMPSQGTYDPATGRWALGGVAPSSTAALVIIARADALGVGVSTTTASADQFDPRPANNTASSTVSTGPVISPGVVALQRFGFHWQPTSFTLTFNAPLDPSRAQDVANYQLVQFDAKGHPTHPIRLVSATYDPATNTVVLRPSRRVYLYGHYQLTVNGSTPNGLTDTSGVYLGGTRVGELGVNYVRAFGREILAGPNPIHAIRQTVTRHVPSGPAHRFVHPISRTTAKHR